MSKTKRRLYFVVFSILFLVATPLVILYAMGYRFDFAQKFFVTERGGVYVYSAIPGTNIYLDGELKDTTGLFNREYLSQNIKPGRYFVKTENEGYRVWEKYIEVDAQRVTSVYPFLVPDTFTFTDIPRDIEDTPVSATTTTNIPNTIYLQYKSLFVLDEISTTTAPLIETLPERVATTTKDEDLDALRRIFGSVQVWYNEDEQKFYAEWLARGDFLPSYFCENGECVNPMVFLEVNSPVVHFDFYPGRDDVIIFSAEDGSIHAVEIDKRPQQTVSEIYRGQPGAVDFRLTGRDTLVIKDGDTISTTQLTR